MPELPRRLRGLLAPGAYPHPAAAVEFIATPHAWILLAGEFAYKILRPAPGAGAGPETRRRGACEQALRLNLRYSPDLHLGMATVGQGRLYADARPARAADYALRMHRFRGHERLDRLLAALRIEPFELAAFGRDLAGVHAGLPAGDSRQFERHWEALRARAQQLTDSCARLAAAGIAPEAVQVAATVTAGIEILHAALQVRAGEGALRECHGELVATQLARTAGRLCTFGCASEPAARWMDVGAELAGLCADLRSRNRPLHALELRNGYLAESADYGACAVLRAFEPLYCLARAVACAQAAQTEADAALRAAGTYECLGLLRLAQVLGSGRPRLLLVCGPPASGRTSLCRALAPRLGAVTLRPQALPARGEPARDLAAAVAQVLDAGYTALVDAAPARRAQRQPLLEAAGRRGVDVRLIECHAPPVPLAPAADPDVRPSATGSAADAAPFEPPAAEDPAGHIRIDARDPRAVDAVLRELRG